jgi:glucan phosphoethanolaminetransferase (alkaline phosphatase superfamily)
MQVPKAIWASMVPAASWAAASEAVTTESTSTAAESVSSAATEAASTGHANWSAQLTNWLAAIDAVLLVSATILTIAVTIREWRIRNEIKEIERKYNPTNANQVSSPKSRPKQTAETPPGNLNRYQRRELRKRRRQDDANP